MKQAAKQAAGMQQEQRRFFRFAVQGEAMLFLLDEEKSIRCRIDDLSLGGCRLRKEDDFAACVGTRLEVAFRLSGSAFRFAGALAWSQKNRVLGIQFQNMNARRREELAEILGGMREELDARERARQVVARLHAAQAGNGSQPAAQHKRERRIEKRHTVDARASIHLLSLHARLTGTIIDVSMSGCRIRTFEHFPVGAYRRVEVEFAVDGLPLLLAGVTQVIHNKWTVGVRFVELTARKRDQLKMVIEEIHERNAAASA